MNRVSVQLSLLFRGTRNGKSKSKLAFPGNRWGIRCWSSVNGWLLCASNPHSIHCGKCYRLIVCLNDANANLPYTYGQACKVCIITPFYRTRKRHRQLTRDNLDVSSRQIICFRSLLVQPSTALFGRSSIPVCLLQPLLLLSFTQPPCL